MDSFLRAEISTAAVRDNLQLLRGSVKIGTGLCAVVKGDCYGHGLELLLDTIADGADALAVMSGPEALAVRDLGYSGPLVMLFSAGAYADAGAAGLVELIRRDVTLTIVSTDELRAVAKAAGRISRPATVHVMIDTGMGRSGIPADEAPALVAGIRACGGVKLTGLYTHFATADEPDKSFALRQLDRFGQAVDACGGGDGLILHAANSAATIELPEAHLDMVRPGLSVYGYQPAEKMSNRLPLVPALRLTAPLMQVKDIPAGGSLGYGLTYRFRKAARVGLVPIGYADGYLRSHSNRAVMRVGGAEAPVRGRVSMDQTIIDLSAAGGAKVGDEVEIISNDPSAPNSVENLARLAGTIPQEICCRLGGRVRRIRVD